MNGLGLVVQRTEEHDSAFAVPVRHLLLTEPKLSRSPQLQQDGPAPVRIPLGQNRPQIRIPPGALRNHQHARRSRKDLLQRSGGVGRAKRAVQLGRFPPLVPHLHRKVVEAAYLKSLPQHHVGLAYRVELAAVEAVDRHRAELAEDGKRQRVVERGVGRPQPVDDAADAGVGGYERVLEEGRGVEARHSCCQKGSAHQSQPAHRALCPEKPATFHTQPWKCPINYFLLFYII